MGCGCRNKNKAVEAVVSTNVPDKSKDKIKEEIVTIAEALDINLTQCYLCAKKHIGRAQAFFEEYHNGYPAHIKNLVDSLFDAHTDIEEAFQLWQKTQSQMDMSAGELLGNRLGSRQLKQDHIDLAVKIRTERLKLDQDPLYIPDFDKLKYEIHALQHRVINEELSSNE